MMEKRLKRKPTAPELEDELAKRSELLKELPEAVENEKHAVISVVVERDTSADESEA